MAEGDLIWVFRPGDNVPPSTNAAVQGRFAAATGFRRYLGFVGSGGSADQSAIFEFVCPPQYSGRGFDIIIHLSTDGTSTGVKQFEVSMETTDGSTKNDQDAGGRDFGTATDINITPNGTANNLVVSSAGVISHANAGSPAEDNGLRLKVTNDFNHATNTDLSQVQKIIVKET